VRVMRVIREHPAGSRQSLHITLVGALLGALVTVSTGSSTWWQMATWTLSYLVLALALELILRADTAEGRHAAVGSGSDIHALRSLEPINELVARADRIELLSGTLKTFTERSANIRALYDRHVAGTPVRVLVMAPTGEGARLSAEERQARGSLMQADDLRREIVQSINDFEPAMLAQLLRLYPGSPHSSVSRFGNRYIVTVYTFARGGSSPALTLCRPDHDSFCDGLDRGFQELWSAPSTMRVDCALLEEFGLLPPPR
jgi:hypothetical protein